MSITVHDFQVSCLKGYLKISATKIDISELCTSQIKLLTSCLYFTIQILESCCKAWDFSKIFKNLKSFHTLRHFFKVGGVFDYYEKQKENTSSRSEKVFHDRTHPLEVMRNEFLNIDCLLQWALWGPFASWDSNLFVTCQKSDCML